MKKPKNQLKELDIIKYLFKKLIPRAIIELEMNINYYLINQPITKPKAH